VQTDGSGLCNHNGRGFSWLTAAASHGVHNYAQSDSVTFGCLPFSDTSRHKYRPSLLLIWY